MSPEEKRVLVYDDAKAFREYIIRQLGKVSRMAKGKKFRASEIVSLLRRLGESKANGGFNQHHTLDRTLGTSWVYVKEAIASCEIILKERGILGLSVKGKDELLKLAKLLNALRNALSQHVVVADDNLDLESAAA